MAQLCPNSFTDFSMAAIVKTAIILPAEWLPSTFIIVTWFFFANLLIILHIFLDLIKHPNADLLSIIIFLIEQDDLFQYLLKFAVFVSAYQISLDEFEVIFTLSYRLAYEIELFVVHFYPFQHLSQLLFLQNLIWVLLYHQNLVHDLLVFVYLFKVSIDLVQVLLVLAAIQQFYGLFLLYFEEILRVLL